MISRNIKQIIMTSACITRAFFRRFENGKKFISFNQKTQDWTNQRQIILGTTIHVQYISSQVKLVLHRVQKQTTWKSENSNAEQS